MPNTVFFPKRNDDIIARHSGIDVTWTKTAQRLNISGWYDSCVGIEDTAMTLREFFDALGITKKDCNKAWKGDK